MGAYCLPHHGDPGVLVLELLHPLGDVLPRVVQLCFGVVEPVLESLPRPRMLEAVEAFLDSMSPVVKGILHRVANATLLEAVEAFLRGVPPVFERMPSALNSMPPVLYHSRVLEAVKAIVSHVPRTLQRPARVLIELFGAEAPARTGRTSVWSPAWGRASNGLEFIIVHGSPPRRATLLVHATPKYPAETTCKWVMGSSLSVALVPLLLERGGPIEEINHPSLTQP